MLECRAGIVIALTLCVAGCSRPAAREYELRGQVLSVDQARQQITIKHEDIPRFMPGMTMSFKVSGKHLLDGREPGDLVTATLVVGESEAQLRTLERIGFAPVSDPAARTERRDPLQRGQTVADATLLDEHGRKRRLADWSAKALAVTFTYTRCPLPNFCPSMDRHFKSVQDQVLADSELRGNVQLLSVSFDPDHDTPDVLARHAARLHADPAVWHFVTGSREDLESFASQFGVSLLGGAPPQSEIVHNLRTAIIDGEGRLAALFSGSEWTPSELVTELRHARAGR